MVKFAVVRDDGNQQNFDNLDTEPAEYDRILEKSMEFLAAEKGLGPYVEFGLTNVHGTLTAAIG